MISVHSQDQVVLLPVLGEVFYRVIDDMICPKGAHHPRFLVLHTAVTSAPNALAICTANVPTPPRRAIDQNLLPWLNISFVA